MILKFYKTAKMDNGNSEVDSNICDVVQCERYILDERQHITFVSVYPKTIGHGIDWALSAEERDYDMLFVENDSGKTINKVEYLNQGENNDSKI